MKKNIKRTKQPRHQDFWVWLLLRVGKFVLFCFYRQHETCRVSSSTSTRESTPSEGEANFMNFIEVSASTSTLVHCLWPSDMKICDNQRPVVVDWFELWFSLTRIFEFRLIIFTRGLRGVGRARDGLVTLSSSWRHHYDVYKTTKMAEKRNCEHIYFIFRADCRHTQEHLLSLSRRSSFINMFVLPKKIDWNCREYV